MTAARPGMTTLIEVAIRRVGCEVSEVSSLTDQRRIIFPVSDNYNSRKLLQIFVLPKQGKRLDSSEFSSLRVI